jgi:hypothetical protein
VKYRGKYGKVSINSRGQDYMLEVYSQIGPKWQPVSKTSAEIKPNTKMWTPWW